MAQLYVETAYRAFCHFEAMHDDIVFPIGDNRPSTEIRVGFWIDGQECFAVYVLKTASKKAGAKYRKKELVFR